MPACARSCPSMQIYRMDHFLGKETVQNIMVLRFANGIFEPLWNRDHIDHVQITVAETVGVERRAGFYEETGALRDMVPNHVFQLLSLTAMEPPNSFAADAVRDREGQGAGGGDPARRRRCAPQRRARAIHCRRRAWPAGQGLSRGGGCRAGQHDRNLCRAAARHRQLALGRRAVLSAHRQGA